MAVVVLVVACNSPYQGMDSSHKDMLSHKHRDNLLFGLKLEIAFLVSRPLKIKEEGENC